jgi:WD40 repeat protein
MAGDMNGFTCVWNAVTGTAARELLPKPEPLAGPADDTSGGSSTSGRSKAVQQLSLTPDGRLAAVSADASIRLWDWRAGTYTLVRGSDPAAGSAVQAGTALSDGRLLVSDASGRLSELTPQGDGSYVCTRTEDLPGCAWRLWQLADGIIAAVDVRQQLSVTLLWPGDLSGAMPLDVRGMGAGGERYGVAVTPDGGLMAVTEAGRVEVWSAADLVRALIPTAAPAVPALLGRVSDSDASEASQGSSGSEAEHRD